MRPFVFLQNDPNRPRYDLDGSQTIFIRDPNCKVVYEVFDCHYYLSGYIPSFAEAMVLACGTNFYNLPGVQTMPYNEGITTIDDQGIVIHKPRNNGDGYRHPNTPFPLYTKVKKFANCEVFNWVGPAVVLRTTHKIQAYRPTGFRTSKNITSTFLTDYISQFSETYTTNNIAQ